MTFSSTPFCRLLLSQFFVFTFIVLTQCSFVLSGRDCGFPREWCKSGAANHSLLCEICLYHLFRLCASIYLLRSQMKSCEILLMKTLLMEPFYHVHPSLIFFTHWDVHSLVNLHRGFCSCWCFISLLRQFLKKLQLPTAQDKLHMTFLPSLHKS